ncbi:hypothetical protein [Thalassospira lucentensis]|uniref:hypothetical protein n=1 Tax=Thalassospira lucentensis TaxID=168935 RepID=UPI0003B5ED72|nr:hypothetical protein [Thalassospira lucentensis]RCK21175.1 hypothetical protein TH1_18825 [Thalassospira lucentensis MCCC 1A00383 = DSM 14000]
MKHQEIQKWKSDELKKEITFFYQRLDELLFDYTLDSYKPRMMNPPFLAQELINAIDDTENGTINEKNIDHIIDETRLFVENDEIARELLPIRFDRIFPENEKNKKIENIKVKSQIFHKSVRNDLYKEKCCDLIISSITDGDLTKIDRYTSLFVTSVIGSGYSKQHVYNATSDFFNTENIDGISSIKRYLSLFNGKRYRYTCFINVNNIADHIPSQLSLFDAEIIDDLPDVLKNDETAKKILKITRKDKIIKMTDINAFDIFKAKEISEGILRAISDLYSVFHHKNKIRWNQEKAVIIDEDENVYIANKETNVIFRGRDMLPSRAAKEFDRLLSSFSLIGRKSAIKTFRGIVSLHGISLLTDNPQNQLLNLWIALETVCPGNDQKAKIASISEGVGSILFIKYLKKLVSNHAKDINRYKSSILKKYAKNDGLDIVHSCFNTLALSKHDARRAELQTSISGYPLLEFRTQQLRNILSSKKNALRAIESHIRRVEWQIRRTYRTRNIIVHSGQRITNIDQLVENTHAYIDNILETTMELSCGNLNFDDFDQVFEYCRQQQLELQCMLNQDGHISESDVSFILSIERR